MALVLCTPLVRAADKPVVYNSAEGGDTPLDRAVKKAYAARYTIRDITAAAGYTPPRPVAGSLPRTAQNEAGEPLEGRVLIAYIISERGEVRDPVVLTSSSPELNRVALGAMKEWRFVPGGRKGVPIATTAAQEFVFQIEKAGFETTGIVLYQPDEVLQTRLPGTGHLAAYIGKLQEVLTDTFAEHTAPGALEVVTAVRPGESSRVWIMAPSLDPKTRDTLRERLEAVPPAKVNGGPVAFAICGTLAGGPEPSTSPAPLPPEWKSAAEKLPRPVRIPDDLLETVWPIRD